MNGKKPIIANQSARTREGGSNAKSENDTVLRSKSHRESDENYKRVVVCHGYHRVIICKDEIQWILQVRRSKTMAGARWRALGYFRRRDALTRSSHRYFGFLPTALSELPKLINEGQG